MKNPRAKDALQVEQKKNILNTKLKGYSARTSRAGNDAMQLQPKTFSISLRLLNKNKQQNDNKTEKIKTS